MSKNQNKRVEVHDIMRYKFLSSPKFSPDGSKVAFAVHHCDIESDNYKSFLWIYDIDKNSLIQLTQSGREGAFCWSMNGDEILFVSNRGACKAHNSKSCKAKSEHKNKIKNSRIYAINIQGGEAYLKAELTRSVSALWDTPNGILVKTLDLREPEKLENADYMIFTQIPFCANGSNFTGQRRHRLSIIKNINNEKIAEIQDITPENMEVECVSVNKNSVYITGRSYDDVMPLTTGVWKLNLNDLNLNEVLPQGHYTWACVAENKNQDGILLTGTDMKHHGLNENKKFFVYKKDENNLEVLTPDLDTSIDNVIVCDCRYGIGHGFGDAHFIIDDNNDKNNAYFVSTENYRAYLYSLDLNSGNITKIKNDLRSVDDFDVKNGRAAVIGLKGLELQELFIIDLKNSNENLKCVTSFNKEFLENVDLSVPEYAHIENGTPEGLDCWYMRPVNFEVGKKYPTILHIHGGPKVTFGDVFDHEMQCWAAEGFAVIFCNPRGADGKGNNFADIRGKYGTIDYEDLMTFTDWAVNTLPFVDGDRLGVTGGSYGGYMTNWIIGHTNRFCAAVSQRSISNWTSKAGMSDIGYYFVPDQQLADIGEDINALWDCSPLKFASQVCTPTLLIHSDQDQRCELGQGLQFFTALKKNGVDAKICVFKGENHDLSRSGSPRARLARLQEIIKWFKEHF